MVLSTLIMRASDGLPLSASVDDGQENLSEQKKQCKLVTQKLSANSADRASIESGNYVIHYLMKDGIVYYCISEASYPRKLAFSYLDELDREFQKSHGQEALKEGVRPYKFVEFDTFMQKTKRVYQDTRATHNLDKLNTELQDVTRVMTKNIEDLLHRGHSLDHMSDLSSNLRTESKKYRRAAQRINWEAMIRQYIPFIGVGLIGLFMLCRASGFRAARVGGAHVTRQQVRHNSGGLNSLWSWFKRKDASKKEAAAPVIKTKDLVKNIEQQSKAGWEAPAPAQQQQQKKDVESKDEQHQSLASDTAVDLEVIGLPLEHLPLGPEKLAEVGLGKFQLKQAEIKPEAALETLKAVSTAVVGGMDGALDTLEKRLELVKRFQKESGIRIPDLIISTVSTPQGVASYLDKSLNSNFNYWEPNAIYLDAKEFEGSNVTVVDAQQLRKQRQQAMDDLVAEAEQFVEQHDKETFKKALN